MEQPISPAARPAIWLIRAYQKMVSPSLGTNCRFHPTCSSYAMESIGRFGLLRGGALAAKRLGRCHPLVPGGFDPVPDSWRADR